MTWKHNFWKHGHRMFVVFIELKLLGNWVESPQRNLNLKGDFIVSTGTGSEIEIIEPDGLRRHLSFAQDATITIEQNILSYNPKTAEEITVDEQEQSGKGKTRDILH